MKKIHIVFLILIAGAIAVLISFLGSSSSYETIAEAKGTPGKFVHVAVTLDKLSPVEYDKKMDYLHFHAIDVKDPSQTMQVVYTKGNRPDLYEATQLVLKGKYMDGHFECADIQTKCPSKYKDDMKAAQKNAQDATQHPAPGTNSSAN